MDSERKLMLINAQLLDRGDYSCTATNVAGNATLEYLVSVLGEYLLSYIEQDFFSMFMEVWLNYLRNSIFITRNKAELTVFKLRMIKIKMLFGNKGHVTNAFVEKLQCMWHCNDDIIFTFNNYASHS